MFIDFLCIPVRFLSRLKSRVSSRRIVKLKDLRLETIFNFDIYNPRADKNGYVKEWVARNERGNAVAFGNTKAECLEDARRYIRVMNKG